MRNSTCVVCRRRYDQAAPVDGPGRDSLYCSRTCMNLRDRALRTAEIELARGTTPKGDDIRPALDRAETLLGAWLSHDHGGHLTLREDLVYRHWAGHRPGRRHVTPDPRAVRALLGRVADLRQLAAQHEREQRRKCDEQRKAARAQRDRETQRQATRADEAWREALLAEGSTP